MTSKVQTKVEENSLKLLMPEIKRTGLELAGTVPMDNQVLK